ncbi:hypothetical protein OE88DRAFT_1668081 [Heliocybe sulcata]|uniref:Uncharacterized protein n=1 Tax=Heliocybe sulcata TaxID=5364 RepID=A0A5C3MPA4_9AGAM|nr:hypothetical protein OE88DRAFT_1668081 [Heliocybe sulcata]
MRSKFVLQSHKCNPRISVVVLLALLGTRNRQPATQTTTAVAYHPSVRARHGSLCLPGLQPRKGVPQILDGR